MFENRNNLLLPRGEVSTFIAGLFVEFTFFWQKYYYFCPICPFLIKEQIACPSPRPQKDPHWKCPRDGIQLSKSLQIVLN